MKKHFEMVVMGVSAGGLAALKVILPALPGSFPIPVVVVQHSHPNADAFLANYLDKKCRLTVKEVEDKENIEPGFIYIAPPNYHLLIEGDKSFSLSVSEPVNYARPSIDVLFETAADIYGPRLIGIILTGANCDGSRGMKKIKERGGLTIVQDPETAEVDSMPRAAIAAIRIDYILRLEEIAPFLISLKPQ